MLNMRYPLDHFITIADKMNCGDMPIFNGSYNHCYDTKFTILHSV